MLEGGEGGVARGGWWFPAVSGAGSELSSDCGGRQGDVIVHCAQGNGDACIALLLCWKVGAGLCAWAGSRFSRDWEAGSPTHGHPLPSPCPALIPLSNYIVPLQEKGREDMWQLQSTTTIFSPSIQASGFHNPMCISSCCKLQNLKCSFSSLQPLLCRSPYSTTSCHVSARPWRLLS